MPKEKNTENDDYNASKRGQGIVRFEVFGEEMAEKTVKMSGNSGRVYLPSDWVGCRVKIIRMDSINKEIKK